VWFGGSGSSFYGVSLKGSYFFRFVLMRGACLSSVIYLFVCFTTDSCVCIFSACDVSALLQVLWVRGALKE